MTSQLNVDTIADKAGTGPVGLTKQSAAKVYVRWENVGTVSTADSLSVSSITDNASADDTINFSNSFSADNFSSGGHAGQGGGTASDPARSLHQRETATSSTRVRTAYPATMAYQEAGYASLIIHGDLA